MKIRTVDRSGTAWGSTSVLARHFDQNPFQQKKNPFQQKTMSNEEKPEKRRWTRTRKWVTGVLLVLLVLLGIVRWLIQSDLLFNYLRDLAEQEASAMLNGSLSIDRINGDLWKTLEITGVQLQNQQGETLLTTDTLRASWSLLDLIRSPHELEELVIAGLEVHAEQATSDNWNLLN